jgi:acyl-CoA thioester hydrolase
MRLERSEVGWGEPAPIAAGVATKKKTKGCYMYSKTLVVGWGDMDFNAHMGAAAYLVKCFDLRMMYFAENGYPMGELTRLRLGPVGMKDELEYFSEVGLLDTIVVTMSLTGMSTDGSRWRLRQEVLRPDGKACARLTSSGGWMDLAARKLAAPPAALLALLKKVMVVDDFVELPSSLKPASWRAAE